MPIFFAGIVFLFVIAILWSIYWKAIALWKAARRGEKIWFGAFLLINTLGILEILYLYKWSKLKENAEKDSKAIDSSTE